MVNLEHIFRLAFFGAAFFISGSHAYASHIDGTVRCLQSEPRFRASHCDAMVMRYWKIEPLISQVAIARGLEPALLKALVAVESGYNPLAMSKAGARGLTQVIPSTAMSLGQSPDSLWDSKQSLTTGARYLAAQWYTFKDWPLAIAAYNAGPGAVKRYGGVPPYPETQSYVNNVLNLYRLFKATRV